MKKFVGWIELVLGSVLMVTPIIVLIIIMQFSSELKIDLDPSIPDAIEAPVEGASSTLQTVIDILSAAYLLIIFLIGLLMFLEGLAKIKN